MKRLLMFVLITVATSLTLAKPTLVVEFDRAQELHINNKSVTIDGNFTPDGYLVYGKKGIAIPAETLLGENTGTIIVNFKANAPKKISKYPRGFVVLRNKGRASLALSTSNYNNLQFGISDQKNNPYRATVLDKIVFGEEYQAAITYDGVIVRIYLNGKFICEGKQNIVFDKPWFIHIGPYSDGWYKPPAWEDDCFVKRLTVFNRALDANEIFAISGAKTEELNKTEPPILTIGKAQSSIKIDGTLDDDAWKNAGGMAGLIAVQGKCLGWTYPENHFKLTYDDKNLYLGTETVFPRNAVIKDGFQRDAQETDVWGYESWEFYLIIDGKTYRFGGNVAGGYVESIEMDKEYNPAWQYKSTKKMRIDDRIVWQSESAIPWSAFGLNAPPKKTIKFNFCRSWFLPELSSYGSLTENGAYANYDAYVELTFSDKVPTIHTIVNNDPSTCQLEHRFFVSGSGKVKFVVKAASLNNITVPEEIFSKELNFPVAGGGQEIVVDVPLMGGVYDALQYLLLQDNKVVMRQSLPFYLSKNYLKITPLLLQGKVEYEVVQSLLKADFPGIKSFIQLTSPDGKALKKEELTPFGKIAFSREYPAGNYYLQIIDSSNNKAIYSASFNHPGIGEWEKQVFDNRIIPPFIAQKSVSGNNNVSVSMWGRTYTWEKSLFPSQIMSQNEPLLSQMVALEIDGKAVVADSVKLLNAKDHRSELKTTSNSSLCAVDCSSWIEYDGVNYNKVKLKANKKLDNVKLKITMPALQAKFLHTALDNFWGAKITDTILPDYYQEIGYFPFIWMGEHEKGLSFFTETRSTWEKGKDVMTVKSDGKNSILEIFLAREIPAGDTFEFEFGLLASPVKPLPENYPLNTFGYYHNAPMNRNGRRPTADIMLSAFYSAKSEAGGWFCDLPNEKESRNRGEMLASVDLIHKTGGRSVAYSLARLVSEEYPEISAYLEEWKCTPGNSLDYSRDGKKFLMPTCCLNSSFSAFNAWKVRDLIKRIKMEGIYFDGSKNGFCSNKNHGCGDQRMTTLAMREFYRRIILVQLDAGIKDPIIVLHNTDSVQLPAFTFGTHLYNGEHIRQSSSTILHDGKDILDTYDVSMFASELSSLPFGLTNSVYHPSDRLLVKYGGDPNEDPELYKFRVTKPVLAGTLVHNTIPGLARCHFGIFDKVVRIYDKFDVPKAQFIGYWKKPAKVINGKDIFVSVYKHKSEKKLLAVISHIGKDHSTQDVDIDFDLDKLGISKISNATELLTADDPEYQDLYKLLKNTKLVGSVSAQRNATPLKLGDFGVKITGFEQNKLKMNIKFHSFALVEIK